jgi:hypothetical protein
VVATTQNVAFQEVKSYSKQERWREVLRLIVGELFATDDQDFHDTGTQWLQTLRGLFITADASHSLVLFELLVGSLVEIGNTNLMRNALDLSEVAEFWAEALENKPDDNTRKKLLTLTSLIVRLRSHE